MRRSRRGCLSASPACGEAAALALPRRAARGEGIIHLKNPDWRYLLDKIRTFFDENPEIDF